MLSAFCFLIAYKLAHIRIKVKICSMDGIKIFNLRKSGTTYYFGAL